MKRLMEPIKAVIEDAALTTDEMAEKILGLISDFLMEHGTAKEGMLDLQQEELRKLAEDMEEKRLLYQRCMMWDIYGRTPDEMKKMSGEYAVAQAKFHKAVTKLREAIADIGGYNGTTR